MCIPWAFRCPIYVFYQSKEMWYMYTYGVGMFLSMVSLPVLQDKAAVIGARKLSYLGEVVIEDIIHRTFGI